MGFSKHIRYPGIRVDQSVFCVHKENDHIRRLDRDLRLFPHLTEKNIIGFRLDSACIDQRELVPRPAHLRIDPVAGHTRSILDN